MAVIAAVAGSAGGADGSRVGSATAVTTASGLGEGERDLADPFLKTIAIFQS